MAALSARVGSIELARTPPDAILVGLHPGTVDTPLSQPFQRNVAPRPFLDVIDGLASSDSGHVFDWQGARVPV